MENKEGVLKAYQKLLEASMKNNNLLAEYKWLETRFNKAMDKGFDAEDKKSCYAFQAIVRRLSEVTMLIKAT